MMVGGVGRSQEIAIVDSFFGGASERIKLEDRSGGNGGARVEKETTFKERR